VAVGVYPDISTAVENMVQVKKTYIPDAVVNKLYNEKFFEYQTNISRR